MTEMKEITLTAIYEEAEEGGYIGYVAELPGANAQGETLQETRENLVDAVMLILETNREEAERRLAATAKVGRDSEGNKRAFGLARCLTMKRRDLLRYPEAHGRVFLREVHDIRFIRTWRTVLLSAVPRHRHVKRGLVRKICDDLDVPRPTGF